jgi:hypothetical protein
MMAELIAAGGPTTCIDQRGKARVQDPGQPTSVPFLTQRSPSPLLARHAAMAVIPGLVEASRSATSFSRATPSS